MCPFKSDEQRKGFYSHSKYQSKKSKARERLAMQHSNKLGVGAKKRKNLSADEKFEVVMKEWKRGTLHSSDGSIVPRDRQDIAVAIAYSEARKIEPNYKTKKHHSLTSYEKSNIKKSIKEERKAQKDYKIREKGGENKKIKSTFHHIGKEEKQHEKELKELV